MSTSAHPDLKDRFVSGVSWSAGAQAIHQTFQLVITIILARHLLPADYGLVAMVLVFTGFTNMFIRLGFSSAMIQHQNLDSRYTSSVFWINIAAGLAFTVVFYASAPYIADFYGSPALEPVAKWLSLTFIVFALGLVPEALIRKSIAFDCLAKVDVLALLIPGVLAVYLAVNGWGVWSLVIQNLVNLVIKNALYWYYCPWRPQLRYSSAAIRELFGYSANLTGYQFVYYWAGRSDALFIGKFMDSASLGIYTRAYTLVLIPITASTGIIGHVMFPILSSIQNDKERVKRVYLRTIRLMAFITFPIMLGLFVLAESFVLAVLGAKWAAVAPIIQIFCFFGITQTLCQPTGAIYSVQARTDLLLRWGLASSAIMIVAIMIGVSFGVIEAVALAYVAVSLAMVYPCLAISGRLIGMTFSDVIGHVAGIFGCAAAMAAGVWGVGLSLPSDWPAWAYLIVQVPAGFVLYVVIAWLVKLDALMELRDIALQLKNKRKIVSTYG